MSVFMYIGLLYDLSIFIFGMFYWDVFYCAWQGPMEEQSCTEWFFTLYKYIWNKKIKKIKKCHIYIHKIFNYRYIYMDIHD